MWLKCSVCVLLLAGCASDTVGLPAKGGADASVKFFDAAPGGGSPDAPVVAVVDAAVPAVDAPRAVDAAPSPVDAPPATGSTLKTCTGRAFPKHMAGAFDHFSSDVIASFSVEHAGFDVLAVSGTSVAGSAKLEYGAVFKDLEDEWVRVYIDDCSDWKLLGQMKTDSDGRVYWTFGPLETGIYDVRWEVVGDATSVAAQLWVLPKGTHVTIYDIDGTLTTSDFELIIDLFADLVSGDYVPEAYPGAVAMTRAYRLNKEVGVYMTGRPYYLTRTTREWLAMLGFERGPLFLARNNSEALPTDGGVGTFKLQTLNALEAAGFKVDTAQGNATTDIYAYNGAGIPPKQTWIIGKHAGEGGTNAEMDSWEPHVTEILGWRAVVQPFDW